MSARLHGHINIPVFIPHLGCPNDCVFCNQRSISGVRTFDADRAEQLVDEAVLAARTDGREAELAFFGGSFTGIDRGLMIRLLAAAARHIEAGRIGAIRLSTRPDYIDGEILSLLEYYGVTTVELGIQSFSDRVLEASKRGHTAACGEAACVAVKAAGFKLVGQMMIGLPLSTPEDELHTASRLCELGADGARIYPTAVFSGTRLCEMTDSGEYIPLTNREAVERAAGAYGIFTGHGVPVIRIGLCESETLDAADGIVAGARHPALGELVMGEYYYGLLSGMLRETGFSGGELQLRVARGETSKLVGHRRVNLDRLREKFAVTRLAITEDGTLTPPAIRLGPNTEHPQSHHGGTITSETEIS